MAIKTVAVVGASGNIGKEIVLALLAANFTVTAITRPTSTATFPEGVIVRKADTSSVESLTEAFRGQDAVISAIATLAAATGGGQDALVDAAVAAGVKRFIPSEFGANTRKLPSDAVLATLLKGKIDGVNYLIKKAEESGGKLTWTGLANGLFLDWGLDMGMLGINLADKSATMFDSGNETFNAVTLAFVGRAVASILEHEEETANQYIEISQFNITQNELLKTFEEVTGAKFSVTNVPTAGLEAEGHEKLNKGDMTGVVNFLLIYVYQDGCGHGVKVEDTANKTLGLVQGDLKAFVKGYVESKSA